MKKTIFFSLLFLFGLSISAQQLDLIPAPVNVKLNIKEKPFLLDASTKIIASDSLKNSVSFLNDYLKKYLNVNLNSSANAKKNSVSTIKLEIDREFSNNLNEYSLTVNKSEIKIRSASANGVFYGIQTLIQLLPYTQGTTIKIPAVTITDYPRFDYRGMHLDVSRHFFDVAFIKKYIDYLALHKMNYFHWHLTDDHGWRIEIKKYPELTSIGSWRNSSIIGLYPGTGNDNIRYGGFYTQEEIKEVIKYASNRYITIIPEIEMPGHSIGVLAAYPQFGTTPSIPTEVAQTWGIFKKFNNVLQPTEETFRFLEDVLTEVMELFPSKYIHIGGDECAKKWWQESAVSQQIIKENNLKDENALQSYFIKRIEKFVNSKGKNIIGWDEILEGGLAPNAVVMSWQGEKGGITATKEKHKVIMTPNASLYFNHAQFVKEDSLTATKPLLLETVYNYDPVPKELNEEESKFIWGAQGCLWSEYITNPAKVDYMLFPRLDALSEILWSPRRNKDYLEFLSRLKTQNKRHDLMKIKYNKRNPIE